MVAIKCCLALVATTLLPYAAARQCVATAIGYTTGGYSPTLSYSASLKFQGSDSSLDSISSEHDDSFNVWDPITLTSDQIAHPFVLRVQKPADPDKLIGSCDGDYGNAKGVPGEVDHDGGAWSNTASCSVVVDC